MSVSSYFGYPEKAFEGIIQMQKIITNSMYQHLTYSNEKTKNIDQLKEIGNVWMEAIVSFRERQWQKSLQASNRLFGEHNFSLWILHPDFKYPLKTQNDLLETLYLILSIAHVQLAIKETNQDEAKKHLSEAKYCLSNIPTWEDHYLDLVVEINVQSLKHTQITFEMESSS